VRTRGLWPLLQAVSRFWICSGVFATSRWFCGKPRDGGVVNIGIWWVILVMEWEKVTVLSGGERGWGG